MQKAYPFKLKTIVRNGEGCNVIFTSPYKPRVAKFFQIFYFSFIVSLRDVVLKMDIVLFKRADVPHFDRAVPLPMSSVFVIV